MDVLGGFGSWLLANNCSEETERSYLSKIKLYRQWLLTHEVMPEEADPPAVEAYIASLRRRHLAASTVRNSVFAIRKWYAFLNARGVRCDNPANEGITPPRPRPRPKLKASEQSVMLLQDAAYNQRDIAIVDLFYSSGVRLAELASIQIQDIHWTDEAIEVLGKGAKWRLVRPGCTTMAALREIAGGRESGPLWLRYDGLPLTKKGVAECFRRLVLRSGVKTHPHHMRHTFAQNYLTNGGDLGSLKELLGHANIETTGIYQMGNALERGLKGMAAMDMASHLRRP